MGWMLRVLFFVTLSGVALAVDPSPAWLPITTQELQLKEVPGNPGASAVQLYFAHYISESDHSEFFYHRIKVLNENGRSLGDVEVPVPFYRRVKIQELQARTILPDGKIVEYTGTPFEKVILQGRGVKFLAQTFTLPEVSVGSILEYKYKLKGKRAEDIDREWEIEQDLFTVREHFLLTFPESWLARFIASPGMDKKPNQEKGRFELEMRDVPAFEREEQMPPEQQYRLRVMFLYGTAASLHFWEEVQAAGPMSAAMEEYVAPRHEIRQAAAQAVGAETVPEQKLRKLYARAQQVRNLTYERDRTEAEEKKEQLKENKNAADVIKHGYGNRNEINLLFVALARAAGFNTSPVLVASRRRRLFDNRLPAISQTDSMITLVNLNNRNIYLDPGTHFCPYGLLRWIYTATTAVQLHLGMTTFQTPDPGPGGYMIDRTSDMVLGQDGSLKGDLIVDYHTGEALEHRLEALATDEAGRRNQLEDEVKSWLPPNSVVQLVRVDGWETPDTTLMATFTAQIPAFATLAGKRLLVSTCLFSARRYSVFSAPTRKYPVYFPYPFREVDHTAIHLPTGYILESVPPEQNVEESFASYRISNQFVREQLLVERGFMIGRMQLTPGEYPRLKDFFDTVGVNDGLQVVVRQSTGSKQE